MLRVYCDCGALLGKTKVSRRPTRPDWPRYRLADPETTQHPESTLGRRIDFVYKGMGRVLAGRRAPARLGAHVLRPHPRSRGVRVISALKHHRSSCRVLSDPRRLFAKRTISATSCGSVYSTARWCVGLPGAADRSNEQLPSTSRSPATSVLSSSGPPGPNAFCMSLTRRGRRAAVHYACRCPTFSTRISTSRIAARTACGCSARRKSSRTARSSSASSAACRRTLRPRTRSRNPPR